MHKYACRWIGVQDREIGSSGPRVRARRCYHATRVLRDAARSPGWAQRASLSSARDALAIGDQRNASIVLPADGQELITECPYTLASLSTPM